MPFLGDLFGNPHSSDHSFGHEASNAIKHARAQVADLMNADDDEIVFTSGATESCNLALRGGRESPRKRTAQPNRHARYRASRRARDRPRPRPLGPRRGRASRCAQMGS